MRNMRNIRTVSPSTLSKIRQKLCLLNVVTWWCVCAHVCSHMCNTTTRGKDPVLWRSERHRLWEKLSFTFLLGERKWVFIFISSNAQIPDFGAHQCSAIRSRVFWIRNIRIFWWSIPEFWFHTCKKPWDGEKEKEMVIRILWTRWYRKSVQLHAVSIAPALASFFTACTFFISFFPQGLAP